MKILCIDPGCTESAYVLMDKDYKPLEFGKVENIKMLCLVEEFLICGNAEDEFVIEMVASYGMAVGKEVFETVFWIGRFWQAYDGLRTKVYRKDVKMNLCGQTKAKDTNIRQALIDRFGVVGVKKNPGWFYGFKADIWQAYATGITYLDNRKRMGVRNA